MNPFEMVLGIIIVGTIGRILSQRYQLRGRGWAAPEADTAETRMLRDEVRTLKERVQVLERVVTDTHASAELDREIERLRVRADPEQR